MEIKSMDKRRYEKRRKTTSMKVQEKSKGKMQQDKEMDETHKMGKERDRVGQWNTPKCSQKAH